MKRSKAYRAATDKIEAGKVELNAQPTDCRIVLDEAAMRDGLGSDLGTGPGDSAERVRRAREVALLMARAGIDVLVAVEASSADAWPGRSIDEHDVDELGADEWVI